MERYTNKNENGIYEIEKKVAMEEATERLARFENVYEALQNSLADAEEKMEEMRSQGKVKSVTFQQFLVKKINYDNLLKLFAIHGIGDDGE